ncbi:PKD domain-containing protein [Sediminibacterium sp.]|uniref:PKD domain-containing protein n=1 Tax=Sediminibacterium sp. TaxID=1917865 RepID=UPI0025F1D18E|nr:PKD domain-containing protein [Sediminibacterium sp.]
MFKNITTLSAFFVATVLLITGCTKTEYNFGAIKAPTGLTLNTVIAGVDASNPNGNGTGNVAITVAATNAITYNIDFGDGKTQVVPTGKINYRYTTPGTNEFTIVVNAIGTGGSISTISKKITVFVAFEIPTAIVTALTGGTSKTWVTDKGAVGHFGVGPANEFAPIWYAATPDSREACAYDDEISFSKDANNNITMTIDNKGQSFAIGAASAFYGFSGGDACFAMSIAAPRKLSFMDASTGSTAANSTRIAFTVPGNGIINFGTGGTSYEILAISATELSLRNIGIDGNSWYQKLKVK